MAKHLHHPKNKLERLQLAEIKGNKNRRSRKTITKETQDDDRNPDSTGQPSER